MLRGAFGVALKRVVCINPKYRCEGCFSTSNCIYYDFFEIKNKFHLYRFSKALKEQNFDFSFYLFEEACEKLPYILNAFIEMITKQGLGVERKKFGIKYITCNERIVFQNDTFDTKDIVPKKFEIDNTLKDITLLFQTPLRIKSDNKLLSTTPKLEQILSSILNRLNEFKNLPMTRLPFEPSYEEAQSSVIFKDLTRRSNRQNTKMKIGGILGYVKYKNIDEKSYAVLKLGEIIGAGKLTVFGLGEIKVEKF
jgi:CRISPR-associated endoribonuclease Cas6